MTALLEARNVTKRFGGGLFNKQYTLAVDNVSLSVGGDTPTVTAIAGESGSGKTTLARMLLNMLEPTEGSVEYKGKSLSSLSPRERKDFRREVQAIFQDPFEVFNPFYKVDAVLTTPANKFNIGSSKAERREMIEHALEMAGLLPNETLGRYPHQLSGGQRQRVMVARAMLIRPSVILADEPVSMVDASLRATILDSLLLLNRDLGISIVYITHDLTTAFQVCDNIMVMYQGSAVEVGTVENVIGRPEHPYTRLLVESIPLPDPERKWGGVGISRSGLDDQAQGTLGCKFAPRCPAVMPQCLESLPPLFKTGDRQASACFLYEESQPVSGEDAAGMLLTGRRADLVDAQRDESDRAFAGE